MMWRKKTNCMWEHLIIHTSSGNVYPLDLSILTSIVLAADSVLYWTHPFVKIKEILYSHFQFSALFKKLLQCGLSCESIEDSFDEPTVRACVKSDLENFFWVMRGCVGASLHTLSFFHWPLSLSKFIYCHNKNNSLPLMPNCLRVFWGYGCLIQKLLLLSATQSCPTHCDPMDCSTPGFPVLHHFPELAQTYVHWVDEAIQPSCPPLSPSPPAFNLSQHQGLFQWVGSLHQVAKVLELQLQHQSFQWIFRVEK